MTRKTWGQSLVLLVVDDHEEILRTQKALLSQEFGLVLTAATVKDALGLLARAHIDIVLCDWNLPDGVGAEVAGATERPVVIHTGGFEALQPSEMDQIRRAAGVVEKPTSRRAMIKALREAYELRKRSTEC